MIVTKVLTHDYYSFSSRYRWFHGLQAAHDKIAVPCHDMITLLLLSADRKMKPNTPFIPNPFCFL
jgi:hypothetical protein